MKHEVRRADPRRLESLINESGLSFRRTPKSFVFSTCPMCGGKNKLYMSRSSGRFECMKCGKSNGFRGAPEWCLVELTDRSIRDLRLMLYGTAEVTGTGRLEVRFAELLSEEEIELEESEAELPDLVWPYHCLRLNRPGAALGVEYLEGRGLPIDIAMQYDIRYSPQERAVAFPAWMGDRLVGWQLRTIDPTEVLTEDFFVFNRIKIRTEEIPRERVVMFANRLQGCTHAVVTEGPVDALKCHLVGGNVATMGKEVSVGQIAWLMRSGVEKLYLALDPDAAGSINPLMDRIPDVPLHLVEIPRPYKDVGEMPLEAVPDVVLGAKPLQRGKLHVFFKDAHLYRPKTAVT